MYLTVSPAISYIQAQLISNVLVPRPWLTFGRIGLDPPGHKSADTSTIWPKENAGKMPPSQNLGEGGKINENYLWAAPPMSPFGSFYQIPNSDLCWQPKSQHQEPHSRQAASAAGSFFVSSWIPISNITITTIITEISAACGNSSKHVAPK